jgi:hypothetical protein
VFASDSSAKAPSHFVFDGGQSPLQPNVTDQVFDSPFNPGNVLSAEDTVRALGYAQEVSYRWDIANDSILWILPR